MSSRKRNTQKPATKEVATLTPSTAFREAYGRAKAFCEMQRPEELSEAIRGFKAGIMGHMAEVERLNLQAAKALEQ